MKQYVGFIRDHSLSMGHLTTPAKDDYNKLITSFQSAAKNSSIETVASVVKCGVMGHRYGKGTIERDAVHTNIRHLQPLNFYSAEGHSTPLFDSVGELINIFKEVPDYHTPGVSFLVMAVTDGEDNDSPGWKYMIANEIKHLQGTDKWTFVFRVPRGYSAQLQRLGIPAGNIHEWEQTEKGLRESTQFTEQAVSDFYDGRKLGLMSTSTFYSNLKADVAEVRKTLHPIGKEASVYPNTIREGASIKEVSVHYTGNYVKGTVFYELKKREPRVQDYKLICLREKNTRNIYGGQEARDLLGLPHNGTIAVAPGDHKDYEIFIQSTAYNRKIPMNGQVLVWMNARNMKGKRTR